MKNITYSAKLCALLGLFVIALGSTYGIFTYYQEGEKESIVTTASLVIVLDDKDSIGIASENAVPTSDEVAISKVPYLFALKNTGTIASSYKVKLLPDQKAIAADGCAASLIPNGSVKYQLVKDGTEVSRGLLSELTDSTIDIGEIAVSGIHNYQLRVWIASTAGVEAMGKHYHGIVKAELSQSTS